MRRGWCIGGVVCIECNVHLVVFVFAFARSRMSSFRIRVTGPCAGIAGVFEFEPGDNEELGLEVLESFISGLRARVADVYHPERVVRRNAAVGVTGPVVTIDLENRAGGGSISRVFM